MNCKEGRKPNEDIINAFSKTFLDERKENKRNTKDNNEPELDSNSSEGEFLQDHSFGNNILFKMGIPPPYILGNIGKNNYKL